MWIVIVGVIMVVIILVAIGSGTSDASRKNILYVYDGTEKKEAAYFENGNVYLANPEKQIDQKYKVGKYDASGKVYDSNDKWIGNCEDGSIYFVKAPAVDGGAECFEENTFSGFVLENDNVTARYRVSSNYADVLSAKASAAAAYIVITKEGYPVYLPHYRFY